MYVLCCRSIVLPAIVCNYSCSPAVLLCANSGLCGALWIYFILCLGEDIAELANVLAWDAVGAQIEPYLVQHA